MSVGVIVGVLVGVSVSVGLWVRVLVGVKVKGWVDVGGRVAEGRIVGPVSGICAGAVGISGRCSALTARYPPTAIVAPMNIVFTRNLSDLPSEEDPPLGLLGGFLLFLPEVGGGISRLRLCWV